MAHLRRLAVLTAFVVVLAGCSGGPSGKPPIQASATPGGLEAGTATELGLDRAESRTGSLNTTLFASVQGDVELSTERAVQATTESVVYRGETAGEPVVVAVYSVPAVTLLADTAPVVRNPAGSWNETRLANAAQAVYAVGSLQVTSTETATVLGNQTTVRHISGDGMREGEPVELHGSLTTIRHEGDFVTVLVLGPAGADRPETDAVLAGLAHPKK